jgi:transcriptional regulator with XRE-family HTH domain
MWEVGKLNLRELRASRGFQRRFVVSHIGISSKHLNDIEAGRVNLTEKCAKRLSEFYSIDINTIKSMYLEGKEDNNGTKRDFKKTVQTS